MILNDRIWGRINVREGLLIDLMKSPEVKRMDGISQFGVPYEFYPLQGFTRHEHSIGVMLLLRRLGASVEEQAAGLLHDVSHTAFSHVFDWVLGDMKNEGHQDKRHKSVIMNSGLVSIIHKYEGFSADRIAEHESYSLLDRHAPELCADRVDYSMRELQDWAAPEAVEMCRNSLISRDGIIAFGNYESAKAFGMGYVKLQREHWGGAEWTWRYHLFANILKDAISKKIINLDDFNQNDAYVVDRLVKSGDTDINARLNELRGKLNYAVVDENPDFRISKKFRYVDPSFLSDGALIRLSEVDSEYKEILECERKRNETGIGIKLCH